MVPRAGLPFRAFVGILDPVPDGVPNQVRDGLGDRIQQTLIERSVLSFQNQVHLLVALLGHIAHHAGKAPEQLLDRNHADFHDRTLQVVQHACLQGHGIGEACRA